MRRHERGANLVEMALITPLLLLLLAGIADLGRAFNHYIIITNASREGARAASRLPCVAGDVVQRQTLKNAIVATTIAEAAGSGLTLSSGDVVIDPDPVVTGCPPAPPPPGPPISVQVTFAFDTILGSIVGTDTINLRAETTMRSFGTD